MRIIATTQEGYLIDATQTELANLVGFAYSTTSRCPRFEAGDKIEVSKMFRQLYELKMKQSTLAAMGKDLREIADLLETYSPVVNMLTEDDSEKGGE